MCGLVCCTKSVEATSWNMWRNDTNTHWGSNILNKDASLEWVALMVSFVLGWTLRCEMILSFWTMCLSGRRKMLQNPVLMPLIMIHWLIKIKQLSVAGFFCLFGGFFGEFIGLIYHIGESRCWAHNAVFSYLSHKIAAYSLSPPPSAVLCHVVFQAPPLCAGIFGIAPASKSPNNPESTRQSIRSSALPFAVQQKWS